MPIPLLGKYPREFIDFARAGGELLQERVPTQEVVNYLSGRPHDEAKLYSRWISPKKFTVEEISDLLFWAVQRVNSLYSYMFDLTNHCEENEGRISILLLRKRFMTVERILVETHLIVSERDAYVRKTLFFNLHDKYASLMCPPGDLKFRMRIFNRLLKPSHFRSVLKPRIRSLPHPFDSFVPETASQIFESIMASVLTDAWARQRVKGKTVRIRQVVPNSRERGPKRYRDAEIPAEDYATHVIHGLRNTLHGYNVAGERFEQDLSLSKGSIPDLLPDLAWVFMFLLLEDPDGLLSGKWK